MNIDLNSFSCCQADGCGVSKAPIDRGAFDKSGRSLVGTWHPEAISSLTLIISSLLRCIDIGTDICLLGY